MADISIPSLIGSPLTLSHQMQEVLKAWMLQASERQDAIRAMGKNLGACHPLHPRSPHTSRHARVGSPLADTRPLHV